ncbi:unnamed protein product [Aphanomyces euteiches]
MDDVWEAMKRENAVANPMRKKKSNNMTKSTTTKAPVASKNQASTRHDVQVIEKIDLDSLVPVGTSLSPEELVGKCQRDLNSLSDEQQGVRKRAVESLAKILANVDTPMLHATFPSFAKPLFKRFNDPIEKVRDTSIRLTIRFLTGYHDLLPLLPYLMPAVANRIGSTWVYDEKLNIFSQDATLLAAHNRGRLYLPESDVPRIKPREPSEEIRLLFHNLIHTLLQTTFDHHAASLLNAYVYDIICVIVHGLHDSFPDANIRACETLTLLSLNLVSVIKHFAVALVRASKHLLEHRLSKVRVAAMLCIRTVVMVPNVDKCKGAGTEAIVDLLAHQDENVIPVAAFYSAEVKVNLFAKLDQDANVVVRQTFFDTVMIWLTDLPDRYDYESRLMPYLLSAVADECPLISAKAIETIDRLGKRHAVEHPDDVIERTQYAVDGSLFCNFQLPYPPPFSGRPSLGTRLYIRGRCRRFINTLLRELSNWQGPTRVHASRLLVCLLVYCEDMITVDLHLIIPRLIQSWDDVLIKTHVCHIASCCGRFTQTSSYIGLLLPYLSGETSSLKIIPAMEVLQEFLGGMSHANRKSLLAQLPPLTEALASRFLLNSTSFQQVLARTLQHILEHLEGITNLGADPSFESQGRLVSKSLLYERFLRILLTLPHSNTVVQAALKSLEGIAGGGGNVCDAFFDPTWAHLTTEYPLSAWVDWSIQCYEQRLLEGLLRRCSKACLLQHATAITSFLTAIWHEGASDDSAKPASRRDTISNLVAELQRKMADHLSQDWVTLLQLVGFTSTP